MAVEDLIKSKAAGSDCGSAGGALNPKPATQNDTDDRPAASAVPGSADRRLSTQLAATASISTRSSGEARLLTMSIVVAGGGSGRLPAAAPRNDSTSAGSVR